jgi:hypothetical protein
MYKGSVVDACVCGMMCDKFEVYNLKKIVSSLVDNILKL